MLPKRINAIKTITYDVPSIVESLEDMGVEDIDFDAVMEYIQDWVDEDFGSLALGAFPTKGGDSGIVFQDENGEEL